MQPHPPTLASQLASLRSAAQAEPGRALLPAALHALITALLIRLFARLEHLLQLWQAGVPPIPPAHRTAPQPRPTHPNIRRHTRAARVRHASAAPISTAAINAAPVSAPPASTARASPESASPESTSPESTSPELASPATARTQSAPCTPRPPLRPPRAPPGDQAPVSRTHMRLHALIVPISI